MPRHTGPGVNDKKVGSLERGSLEKERVKEVNKGDRWEAQEIYSEII